MPETAQTPNRLISETSPYLLQHASNPVDWYPWGPEAFDRARREDKPVFLSVGYSTCHWCHVMERESFEDTTVAEVLNRGFIAVKVDKEERPDVDSVYMDVCQAFTGSGGWPLTILMTPEQRPFFAGTYIPKDGRRQSVGLITLLTRVGELWDRDRERLLVAGDEAVRILSAADPRPRAPAAPAAPEDLTSRAMAFFQRTFDQAYGGFGPAPKFPGAHNLIFLLRHYENTGDLEARRFAEETLTHMYRGGLFDHIGFGFSRYSTDRRWLAPHFEKMLYDNALLTVAYLEAYRITGKELYRSVAVRTLTYVERELTDEQGGFFCAQDADSEGVEGKYYLFTPEEITDVLGAEGGARFNRHFDITPQGNFEGQNIPNLIHNDHFDREDLSHLLPPIYQYRKERTRLHTDDKILTAWNGLMIAALARAYQILDDETYLRAAQKAERFVSDRLRDGTRMFTSYRDGRRGDTGFLDDYAYFVYAQLALYEATQEKAYWYRAEAVARAAVAEFHDEARQGFFLYGHTAEPLILRPKETYDGAMPSGNAVMAYNLVKLARLTQDPEWEDLAQKQLDFLSSHAAGVPANHGFFLCALQARVLHNRRIVCALTRKENWAEHKKRLPPHAAVIVLEGGSREYPILDGQDTFYLCDQDGCRPPAHELRMDN